MENIQKQLQVLLKRTECLDNLQKNVSNLEEKIDLLDQKVEGRITKLESTVRDLEKAAQFTAVTTDNNKKVSEMLLKKDSVLDNEIHALKGKVENLSQQLCNEQISRNQLAQYHRSALNVILAGVPCADDEDCTKLVAHIASKAGFTGFSTDEIDVAHRLQARKGIPSIIVRFRSKAARTNFFQQRSKLKGKTATSLGLERPQSTVPRAQNGENITSNKIFVLESLTPLNAELLKDAKALAKYKNYKFFGYTFNGEVRVKRDENSNFIAIRSKQDLPKII